MIYAVTFRNQDGAWLHSCYREKLTAARRWAKWLMSRNFVRAVKISEGGHGGDVVEELTK